MSGDTLPAYSESPIKRLNVAYMILELLHNDNLMSSISGNAFNILQTPIFTTGYDLNGMMVWHGIFAVKKTGNMHMFLVIGMKCVTTYVVMDYEHQPPSNFSFTKDEKNQLKELVDKIIIGIKTPDIKRYMQLMEEETRSNMLYTATAKNETIDKARRKVTVPPVEKEGSHDDE